MLQRCGPAFKVQTARWCTCSFRERGLLWTVQDFQSHLVHSLGPSVYRISTCVRGIRRPPKDLLSPLRHYIRLFFFFDNMTLLVLIKTENRSWRTTALFVCPRWRNPLDHMWFFCCGFMGVLSCWDHTNAERQECQDWLFTQLLKHDRDTCWRFKVYIFYLVYARKTEYIGRIGEMLF